MGESQMSHPMATCGNVNKTIMRCLGVCTFYTVTRRPTQHSAYKDLCVKLNIEMVRHL